ncbi:MAG: FAD-dependent monooxygenase [Chromatiales bacterium]
MERYDAVIVGGGLAGLSLASALQRTPARVALIEAVAATAPRGEDDDRGLALSPASHRILTGIGLWEAIAASATPVLGIHVSERGRFGATRLRSEDLGLPALAHVVPAQTLDSVFTRSLHESGNCEMFCPATVTRIDLLPEAVHITLQQGSQLRQLSAKLVVAADGAPSQARAMLGVPVRDHDYRQVAIVASLTPERPHACIAYERFSPAGAVALLPQAAGRCGVVYVVPSEEAPAALACPAGDFLAHVRRRFGRLGELTELGRRSAYPLRLIRAERIAGWRYVIIGNAAHAIHPNAAQGFNLALRDVAVLAELVHRAVLAKEDAGAPPVTDVYATLRDADHRRTIRLSDGLARLFYNDQMLFRLLRNAGLLAVDLVPALKRALVRTASGLQGPVPRLVQGLPL